MLQELHSFRAAHGHCRVPKAHGPCDTCSGKKHRGLARWVFHQRHYNKLRSFGYANAEQRAFRVAELEKVEGWVWAVTKRHMHPRRKTSRAE